ncbi:MAG TPA: hypothetical protein VF789_19095 [Thermoanaerobaculia bacterium]
MSDGQTLQQILANLEAQMEVCREKEAYHAREEAAHREQREANAAELADLSRHYEALRSSAEAAVPLAARYSPPVPEPPKEKPQEILPPGKPLVWSRLADRVIEGLPSGTLITPTSLAKMMDQRYKGLPHPADPRVMSTILRRLISYGWVRRTQKGTSHRETTYVKV